MPPHVQAAQIREHSFVLVTPIADVPLSINGVLGETKLQEEAFLPVLELLASNGFAPKTGAELMAGPPKQGLAQIMQVLALLIGSGRVCPTQSSTQCKLAQPISNALNASLIANAEYSSDTTFLASPLIGGAVGGDTFSTTVFEIDQKREEDSCRMGRRCVGFIGRTRPAAHQGWKDR
jgi:hypothetical protein